MQYGQRFRMDINPAIPLPYGAVMLLNDAVKQANSLDPQRIRDALAANRIFQCVTGTITFERDRNPANNSAVKLKYEKGTKVFVKTIEPK
jgi:branched-chain amino acid transport system substrate-binding protein